MININVRGGEGFDATKLKRRGLIDFGRANPLKPLHPDFRQSNEISCIVFY